MRFHFTAHLRHGNKSGTIDAPTIHAARVRLHIEYAVPRRGHGVASSIVVWPVEDGSESRADVLFSMLGVEV